MYFFFLSWCLVNCTRTLPSCIMCHIFVTRLDSKSWARARAIITYCLVSRVWPQCLGTYGFKTYALWSVRWIIGVALNRKFQRGWKDFWGAHRSAIWLTRYLVLYFWRGAHSCCQAGKGGTRHKKKIKNHCLEGTETASLMFRVVFVIEGLVPVGLFALGAGLL